MCGSAGPSRQERSIPILLKRHAHTVGVNRPEFLGSPRLGLQRTVGMHLAAPLLVFDVQCLNTLHRQTHHGLVADLPCQDFVAHASDVEVRLAAVDTCISWRSSVAKRFLKPPHSRPPIHRLRGVGSGDNGDCAFDDRFHGRGLTNPKLTGYALARNTGNTSFLYFSSVSSSSPHIR